jgi:serine/threonine protein kinase
MAPEICTPPPELSSYKSDVWSYGCVILEITSTREPWIDEFHDDSSLFRALQRRENAPIFARICTNQLGPSYLRDLLTQCCTWSKTNRPSFNDILQYLGIKDHSMTNHPEPMSIDTPVSYESSVYKTDHDNTLVDFKENIRIPCSRSSQVDVDANRAQKYQGRLTGEVYTSRGNASGRVIYEGPQGGRYYLTASGSKVYLHK